METLVLVSSMNVHDWNHIPDEMFGMWDDNGGDPDGNAWLPADVITLAEARPVLDAGLGEMVEARWANDEAMAHFLFGPTTVVDMYDEGQVDGMKNEAGVKTRGWAHYGAYGASDSVWVFIPAD